MCALWVVLTGHGLMDLAEGASSQAAAMRQAKKERPLASAQAWLSAVESCVAAVLMVIAP
jgi:hypothetical protein